MSTTLITTDGIPAAERLGWWGERIWGLIGRLKSDAFGDSVFAGSIEHGEMGYMTLCRLQASRHRVVRTPQLIRSGDRAYLKVVVQLRGRACFEQHGRQAWLAPGDWSVYDTTRAYSVTNPEAVEQLVLLLPKDQLIDRRVDDPRLMVRRFSSAMGVPRLAFEMMNAAFRELSSVSQRSAGGLADSLSQLVQLAVLDHGAPSSELSQCELLRERIKQYVQAHLRDPELSISRIALALNCSRRHLHGVFEQEETTLACYVQALRLDACQRELQAPDHAARSITDIALSWGYNSPAHFCRVFRKRFDATPSEWRSRYPRSAARAA